MARYGLSYDHIRKINPRIIYCSITGFGQTSPYRARPGYDFVFQGLGGLMSITGERDDMPGGGPQKVGIAIADIMTGMYASLAITAAIAYREISGIGQYIDLALLDSIIAFGSNQVLNHLVTGNIPKRYGNAHANAVPYQVFASGDGRIVVALGNDSQFVAYCQAIGRSELADDDRFRKVSGRLANREVLIPILTAIMTTRTTKEWISVVAEAGVPCGPINNYAEVFEDPQVIHRGIKRDILHPLGGTCPTVASPLRFSETLVEYNLGPPLLGQHTDEVLIQLLGKSEAEMQSLKQGSAV